MISHKRLKEIEKSLQNWRCPKCGRFVSWESADCPVCYPPVRVECFFPIVKDNPSSRFEPIKEINEKEKYIYYWSDKLQRYEIAPLTIYNSPCIVCGQLMHVLAFKGTTWFAFCSSECAKEYVDNKEKYIRRRRKT